MGLKVAENKKNFEKDGKLFFYLADTCWSAFTNINENDWKYYLQYRKRQGYNVLQINILPQWDASANDLDYSPYQQDKDGRYRFDKLNETYFKHARSMCEVAKEYGFELALVVLWCNYVPATWANNMLGHNTMPYDHIDEYVKKVNETFTDLEPLYVISGDTDLNEEISRSYYLKASRLLHELAPDCLQSFHVRGRLMEIPEDFIEQMDFYMFQSGHNAKPENRVMPYYLPEYFMEHYPIKPLLNSEPCYEQMGYSSNMYGRFHQFETRRAAWQSILAGASAGITYGAAGIYSWHTYGKEFVNEVGEGFDSPNPWHLAIHYPGAWDYSDIKGIFNDYNIIELSSAQNLLMNQTNDIRVALTNNKLVLVYVPENTKIKLKLKSSIIDKVTIIDLNTRHREEGTVEADQEGSIIGMHIFEHDALYVVGLK